MPTSSSSWAQDIQRDCEQFQAGEFEAANTLVQRLITLSADPAIPASVNQEFDGWQRELAAALQWAETGDERGLGRAVGISIALHAWAVRLESNDAVGSALDPSC
jgi:hypothetical protein